MADQAVVLFDEFVEGGLLDDADVKVNSARWIVWDYKGKAPAVLGLNLNLTDSEGKIHDENLSCGELTRFVPSADGKFAVPVGSQTKLNNNTNAVAFLISLMNADKRGDLATKLKTTGDISSLDGSVLHVSREAQPKRTGLVNPVAVEGQSRPSTRLKVDSIISYPGEGAAPKPGAAPVSAPAAAPAAAAGGVDDDFAVGIVMSILSENGGQIKAAAIGGKAFSNADMKAAAVPVRNATLAKVVSPAFLGAAGRPWQFDAATGTVSFG
jgi:hypothetical protein